MLQARRSGLARVMVGPELPMTLPMFAPSAALGRTRRPLLATAAALVALAAAPAGASAATAWTINIKDGVPSDGRIGPTDSVSFTEGPAKLIDSAPPTVRVLRGSAVVAREYATNNFNDGSGSLIAGSMLPGDVIQVLGTSSGEVYAQVTYDGRPAFGADACGGARSGSGAKAATSAITRAGAYSYVRGGPDYGDTGTNLVNARITSNGPSEAFAVSFDRPLQARSILWAEATWSNDIAVVNTYTERRVVPCPVPPDRTAPKAKLVKPKGMNRLRLSSFTKGLTFTITPDEAVNLRGRIELRTGKGKRKRAVVVGTAKVSLEAKQARKVKIRVTSAGKRRLRKASKTRAGGRVAVVFTVADAAGNTTTLPSTTVKLPRK